MAPEFVWSVDVDTRGSDHYPLFVHSVDHKRGNRSRRSRWRYEHADWNKFAEVVARFSPENVQQLEKAIIEAADTSIPRTSTKVGRKAVHWWTKEVEAAVKNRRQKLRRMRKMEDDNPNKNQALTEFNLARNETRKIVEKSKADSWAKFVLSIAPSSSTTEIWRRVNAFRNGPKVSIQLVVDGKLCDDPGEVAESLADFFAKVLAAKPPTHTRAIPDQPTPTFEGGDELKYNEEFSMEELEWAIRKSKGLSAGIDNIGYPIIRNLPHRTKTRLLELINRIWKDGNIPERWK